MWGIVALLAGALSVAFPQQARASFGRVASATREVFGPFLFFGPPTEAFVDSAALAIAKGRIREHEGYREDVYIDTEGFLTVGIGHKVIAADNLRKGDRISAARIDQFFAEDVSRAFEAAKAQARDLNKYNADFIAALTSVNFQLGTGWVRTFKNTYNDLKFGDVNSAIIRLQSSLWARQTPVRVSAFIDAIENAYG